MYTSKQKSIASGETLLDIQRLMRGHHGKPMGWDEKNLLVGHSRDLETLSTQTFHQMFKGKTFEKGLSLNIYEDNISTPRWIASIHQKKQNTHWELVIYPKFFPFFPFPALGVGGSCLSWEYQFSPTLLWLRGSHQSTCLWLKVQKGSLQNASNVEQFVFLLRRCGWIGVFFDFQPRYLVLEALLMPTNLSRPLKILPRSLKEITIAKIVGSIGHQGKIKVPPSRSIKNKTHSVADWK